MPGVPITLLFYYRILISYDIFELSMDYGL